MLVSLDIPGHKVVQILMRTWAAAYRALRTSILPVDAASREPHVRFLEKRKQTEQFHSWFENH